MRKRNDKVDLKKPKVLSCVFSSDVSCSFRKSEKFGIMNRCLRCPHYKKWEKTMDEEDERITDKVERIRENPEAYLRGELN